VLESRYDPPDGGPSRFAYVGINRSALSRTVPVATGAPDRTPFEEIVNDGDAAANGGILTVTVPAGGSVLYLML
jgi:hypothetical protein